MATHQVAITTEPRLKPVQALNRLADLTTGFCAAQAFRAAWKFGLFEEMSKRAATAEELAGRVNIHPVGCRRLLMALAKLGLVVRDGDLYHNSELGQYCSSQSAVNLGALPASLDPFYHMFEYLPDALREYSPRWQEALGTSQEEAFGALYEDPVRLGRFAELMNAFSIVQGQLIAEHFDFAPYHCLMDVAGGLGGQGVQIGLRHTHLCGVITDLAPVCEMAKKYIETSGLDGRFIAIPTDLFQAPYPPGADVILLGHVLHDWNDRNCRKILRNCFDALPPEGVLLISETVLRPDFSGSTHAHMKDLIMMACYESEARERTEAEYQSLLDETGFEIAQIMLLDAPRDLIVARRR